MTSQEKFVERYNIVMAQTNQAMVKALQRAITNKALAFSQMNDDFNDVYPLIAAVLKDELTALLKGSCDPETIKMISKQTYKYSRDIRIWRDFPKNNTQRKDK